MNPAEAESRSPAFGTTKPRLPSMSGPRLGNGLGAGRRSRNEASRKPAARQPVRALLGYNRWVSSGRAGRRNNPRSPGIRAGGAPSCRGQCWMVGGSRPALVELRAEGRARFTNGSFERGSWVGSRRPWISDRGEVLSSETPPPRGQPTGARQQVRRSGFPAGAVHRLSFNLHETPRFNAISYGAVPLR